MKDDAALHTAGATVQHQSPFEQLPGWQNAAPLSPEFIKTWAVPFYQRIGETTADWAAQLRAVRPAITAEVIGQLLGDFNWRTRQTGAYFAALLGDAQWLDIIGTHLLKSEVCYAGQVYATVLATFNTPTCASYFDRYLTYYLNQPNLWFDQWAVLTAAQYLDEENGTGLAQAHYPAWWKFSENKGQWNSQVDTTRFRLQVKFVGSLARASDSAADNKQRELT